MADDDSKPALARRVPGANLRGKAIPSSSRLGLPEFVLRQVQAAVEAERQRSDLSSPATVCAEPVRPETDR